MKGYLECPVGITLVRPEAFDGDGELEFRVFSITHVCKPALVVNPPDADELSLKHIGGGYDAAGFADLGEKQ